MKHTVLKIVTLALLALALFIPVNMIQGLVAERQARRNEALAGIAEGWGKAQVVGGPYLALPYERRWTEVKQELVDGKLRESRTERKEAQVARLPIETIDWTVDAALSEKARGIYKARLYGATLKASGVFTLPARGSLEDGTSQYRWYVPRLVLGIADPNGIRAAAQATIDSQPASFSPGSGDSYAGGSPAGGLQGGLHLPMPNLGPGEQRKRLSFSFSLELAGSEAFALAPYGADAAVAMRADWPHPSFQGRHLPARHELGADGFSASWKISRLSTPAASGCAFPCNAMQDQIAVSFVEPAGLYQKLERASKYGFLFIGLTFAAFVLLELLRRLAIHPVQYALVGLALAMFFLLLTALSEHIDFSAAYGVATAACVSLVTVYLVRVLKSAPAGLAFGGALTGLYGFLYALLKAEDYSLLGGALLLFALLAAVMLATRRVDWYALGVRPT